MNWYPPYIGAGVKIRHVGVDWLHVQVAMRLRWFNRNAVGSHFGGSLYSMVDPQLMLMLMQLLGREYLVWDQSASIEYVKPAKSTVIADIRLASEDIESIKQNTESGEKYLPNFEIEVKDEDGNLIARVNKTLYIRKKKQHR